MAHDTTATQTAERQATTKNEVEQPRYADCANCGSAAHSLGYKCPCACHGRKYSAAARELAAYHADIYKAKRNARVAKKGGLR